MIVFDLLCGDCGERPEAWFRSSADFDEQSAAGLVECPLCNSCNIAKAPMAPRVSRKGESSLIKQVAAAQADMLKHSRWVGRDFADTARAMHVGKVEPAMVHGEATRDEAAALIEEGIPVAPLPLPFVPPSQVN